MKIEIATEGRITEWLEFRRILFGEVDPEIGAFDIDRMLYSESEQCVFAVEDGVAIGFAEMALRNLVDGCRTSPVGYLEGIYVKPEYRGRGIARILLNHAEQWAISKGCTEFASDTEIQSVESQSFHRNMGFEETFRLVLYRKELK
ncbi:MAG: aminoglycoside 6'-N-acetyltransferase [Verrucomicrobiota bacterium]